MPISDYSAVSRRSEGIGGSAPTCRQLQIAVIALSVTLGFVRIGSIWLILSIASKAKEAIDDSEKEVEILQTVQHGHHRHRPHGKRARHPVLNINQNVWGSRQRIDHGSAEDHGIQGPPPRAPPLPQPAVDMPPIRNQRRRHRTPSPRPDPRRSSPPRRGHERSVVVRSRSRRPY